LYMRIMSLKKYIAVILIGMGSGVFGSWLYLQNIAPASNDVQTTLAVNEQKENSVLNTSQPPAAKRATKSRQISAIGEDFVKASQAATPSVVYIKNITQNRYGSTWLDWFFGQGGSISQSFSSGSGVIYSSNGYIITNNHVVDNADQIEVIIEKRPYPAKVMGTDPSTDLAVLKIEENDLAAIQFASSQDLEVGEWVLAVGNPFNLTSTVTAGIVSAKGRELNILQSNFPIESFIQTDAAINPGNSGGALVNRDGKLVGINTAILSRTGSYAGYGFAVPSDIVKKVVQDIIDFGKVQKAFFGGDVLDIDVDIAKKLELDSFEGVVVSYVRDDGAALKSGIERGDVILKINNKKINSRAAFEEALSYFSPGDEINVVLRRNDKLISTRLTLTNEEGTTELLRKEVFRSRKLGADFEKLSKVERDLLDVENGVRILKVREGLIRKMNLPEGFVVVSINQISIEDPEMLTDILSKIRGRVLLEGVSASGRWQYYRYYF
jgi:serine protease Do